MYFFKSHSVSARSLPGPTEREPQIGVRKRAPGVECRLLFDCTVLAASWLLERTGGYFHGPLRSIAVGGKNHLLSRLDSARMRGLVHLNIARGLFLGISLSQRNLFEVSVMCFLICVASELRALAAAPNEMPGLVKRQVAA